MKKAVLAIGGKQYLVTENQILEIELLKVINSKTDKKVDFQPLLVIDEKNNFIGKPTLGTYKVNAEIVDSNILSDKVTSIRYKAKKRVHKVHGHRQNLTRIKITEIIKS
ncbi:MAG: 50S ribosomal protein L21 [Candidatus Saccharimonadales bacterium]|jgi:large subunit ribosomal protein L21